ncbi:hypothetical protein, partial [Bartonella bovis]|uniref:hypothetical protein n=1 Tax=Bartonella bovis TaxID=155194 RepID=UPI0011AEEDDD
MQNGREMTLNKVGIDGFKMGVHARSGTVKLMGESTITVANSGTGIMVGSGATVSMTQGKIEGGGGSGAGNYGVQGSGAVILNMVDVSGFGKGVDMTAGKLDINMGSIEFESGRDNYGVQVSGEATGTLTSVKIMGKGGQGTGVVMGSSETMTMTNVGISKVKVGVNAKSGTLNMMGGTVTFESGSGNWGVHVQNGASAIITGATIKGSGNGQGTGLYVMGGTATMNGGEIKEVESGVYATGAGTLTINGGAKITVKGGAESYGVKVESGASATLTNMTIEGTSGGTGKGVEVSMGSSKTMTMT